MTAVALDTSLSVPLMLRRHRFHATVVAWAKGKTPVLAGHAAAETYSVITRLPDDARLAPADAAVLMSAAFERTVLLSAATTRRLPRLLADAGVSGGAVYDALVGLAARENGLTLATRDARAIRTYELLGVAVQLVG